MDQSWEDHCEWEWSTSDLRERGKWFLAQIKSLEAAIEGAPRRP
jgi:hypothetical protein